MKEPVYKHWEEWLDEGGFVKVEEQESRLKVLSTYKSKFDQLLPDKRSIGDVFDYILEPNIQVIKEYNTSFVELMMNHSHKYNTKRIVPIQIIRNLIDVGAVFQAYIDTPDKKRFIEEYHKGSKFDKIDKKTISYYVGELNKSYDYIHSLYSYCCNYVHSNYLKEKANSTWEYSVKPGKIGFMGAYYKVKVEDFHNGLIEGMIDAGDIPFDYEEEVDIINTCIKVNNMLLELVEKVKQNS